ncbi:MAG: type VI secretion system-associated protein TagF [Burkholderiaceae bacterium]
MTAASVTAAQHAIGWHGKLPTVGDFATRRLDSHFVDAWDGWLSEGLASRRTHDPEGWLEAYLASPTWRFLLSPGFLPAPLHPQAWTGVLMPSVDKVGRYYPLTLACPLPALPRDTASQRTLWVWLQQLEDAAIDALQDDWSIDLLETELLRLGLPPVPAFAATEVAPAAPGNDAQFDVATPATMQSFFAICAPPPPAHTQPGACVWYSEADIASPRLVRSAGMDASIARLWNG